MKTQARSNKKTPKDQTPAEPQPVKRKVGRPPKADKDSQTGRAKDTKTANARQARMAAKRAGTSTRDLIISSANEIINHTGVVDFRIETLAQSLSLSPGNITYHFPKKEDIISAIWNEYMNQVGEVPNDLLTPLLDVKQLFLYLRNIASKAISFVGVTTYYYGDMGALLKENATYRHQVAETRKLYYGVYETLYENGYMNPIKNDELREMTFETQFTVIRWWVNHALGKYSLEQLSEKMDRYMVLSLMSLLPFLTDAGVNQLRSIIKMIK